MASLFDILINNNYLTFEQLEEAKIQHNLKKEPIQKSLLDLELVLEESLTRAASEASKLPIASLDDEEKSSEITDLIPSDMLKKHGIFPLRKENNTLFLAMSNPQDIMAIDDISALLDVSIRPVLCPTTQIYQYIENLHKSGENLSAMMNSTVEEHTDTVEQSGKNTEKNKTDDSNDLIHVEFTGGQRLDIANLDDDGSPTVKLINLILVDAIKVKASDIHLEPREDCLEVRYRIDGDLRNIMKVPKSVHHKMIARLKILSKLDITQDIKPQDGRLHLMVNGRKVDFRISTIPTYYGEKVVARILDASEAKTDLDQIGFEDDEKETFINAVKKPQGMVLVTGPTGSGKTSSLYAALNYVKGETTNIVTIEDPIEFLNEGINQIQVNPARGVTFATGLRSILRQDPNVILIGEIRDQETAEIAMKASLTGHLVLSTLHTNSAIATISRLIDIGLDNYLVASGVILIASQRLLKKICEECKTEFTPDEKYIEEFEEIIKEYNITKFYKGSGCPKCSFTGYSGRTAVFEVLSITQNMQDLIGTGASDAALRKQATADGCRLLAQSGILKVKKGITTLEEAKKTLGKLMPEQEKESDIKTKAQPTEKEPTIEAIQKKPQKQSILDELLNEEIAGISDDTKSKTKEEEVPQKPIEKPPLEKQNEIIQSEEKAIKPAPDIGLKVPETSAKKNDKESEICTPEIIPITPNQGKEIPEQPSTEENIITEKIQKNDSTTKEDKYTILVAEDERDIQKILLKVLESAGYNVVVTSNGKEAVVSTFKEKPDLLIMDIMMPEMNGFEATEILRSKLETAVIPIIMLTAENDKNSERKGFELGIDCYMLKPFNRALLISKIEELLNKGNLKDGLF